MARKKAPPPAKPTSRSKAPDRRKKPAKGGPVPDNFRGHTFRPGQSGNPAGRPKGCRDTVRGRLRRLLARNAPDAALSKLKKRGYPAEEGTLAEVIALILVAKAVRSEDLAAIREIFDQTELPLKQTLDVQTGDNPVLVVMPGDPRIAREQARQRADEEES